MRVVSADSAAAILDAKFTPLRLVASASVVVHPPYREPHDRLVEPIFRNVENGYEVIVHEAELCRDLLEKTKADVVHLDLSLGAVPIEELSPIQLSNISSKARGHLLKILPKLRKIAADVKRVYGVEVLAIGKDSVPVRIAELTAGAYAIVYAAEQAVKEKTKVRLGLPSKCYARKVENGVMMHSLTPAEHDIAGFAVDREGVLEKVTLSELLNPCARGFRTLEFTLNAASP
jgi:hypothetical protein